MSIRPFNPLDYFYTYLEVYHGRYENLETKILKMAQRRHEQIIWKAIHSWLNNERIHKIRTLQEHDSASRQKIFWMKKVMSIYLNLQKDGFVKEVCPILKNGTWLIRDGWLGAGNNSWFMITVNEASILSAIQRVLYFPFRCKVTGGKWINSEAESFQNLRL